MTSSKLPGLFRQLPTTAAASPPVPHAVSPTASIDLLPIPAALVTHIDGRFALSSCNKPFQFAGLGTTSDDSPFLALARRHVVDFLDGDALQEEFAWQFGDTVDCRHYRVTLARIRRSDARRCLITLIDCTSELRTEHNLRREMMTDSLTGLPNRAGFSDRLEALHDNPAERERHAVLVLDLDRFSRVNACLGSMAGDELLITLARRLKGALRAHDVLARTGGDEFGILLRLEEGPADASHVAKRIQGALGTPFRLCDFEIMVSCSIGIAFGSAGLDDPEELIRHAQFAVKRSKVSGRAESYQTQAFDIAREQFGLETSLRRAIEKWRTEDWPISRSATFRPAGSSRSNRSRAGPTRMDASIRPTISFRWPRKPD